MQICRAKCRDSAEVEHALASAGALAAQHGLLVEHALAAEGALVYIIAVILLRNNSALSETCALKISK